MNNEFKKITNKSETRYVLETMTAGATGASSIASTPVSLGKLRKRLKELKDKISVPTSKPRNPSGMGSTPGRGTQVHKDKKRDQKMGKEKHKKPFLEQMMDEIEQISELEKPSGSMFLKFRGKRLPGDEMMVLGYGGFGTTPKDVTTGNALIKPFPADEPYDVINKIEKIFKDQDFVGIEKIVLDIPNALAGQLRDVLDYAEQDPERFELYTGDDGEEPESKTGGKVIGIGPDGKRIDRTPPKAQVGGSSRGVKQSKPDVTLSPRTPQAQTLLKQSGLPRTGPGYKAPHALLQKLQSSLGQSKFDSMFTVGSMTEGLLGSILPWPEIVNKVNSVMKSMGWKGQRKDDNSYMFSTKGQETDDQYYMVIISNVGHNHFEYVLGTVEEGDPHIGEKDTLPMTPASVSELMNAIRDGFGLNERKQGVAESSLKEFAQSDNGFDGQPRFIRQDNEPSNDGKYMVQVWDDTESYSVAVAFVQRKGPQQYIMYPVDNPELEGEGGLLDRAQEYVDEIEQNAIEGSKEDFIANKYMPLEAVLSNILDEQGVAEEESNDGPFDKKSHQYKTTMKHAKNPTVQQRMAAHDIRPGVKGGYSDRADMIRDLERTGKLKDKEMSGRAVNDQGLTQDQWIKKVKSKYGRRIVKVLQAKMIDGPMVAILDSGEKLHWSKKITGVNQKKNQDIVSERPIPNILKKTSADELEEYEKFVELATEKLSKVSNTHLLDLAKKLSKIEKNSGFADTMDLMRSATGTAEQGLTPTVSKIYADELEKRNLNKPSIFDEPESPESVSMGPVLIRGPEAWWEREISKWGGEPGREIANDLVNAGYVENLKEFLYMLSLVKTMPELKQDLLDAGGRVGTFDLEEYKFYAKELKEKGLIGNQEYLKSRFNDEKLRQLLAIKYGDKDARGQGVAEEESNDGPFEAYGVYGRQSKPWRKKFKNQAQFEAWLTKYEQDVEVHGFRDLEDSVAEGPKENKQWRDQARDASKEKRPWSPTNLPNYKKSQGVAEGSGEITPKEASYILSKMEQGVPTSDILDKFPALYRMMEIIAGEQGLHMDDDFEDIETSLYHELEAIAQQGNRDEIGEGLRDPKDNPCWKGYKPVGTKKKGGKTVPNCVPTNEDAYINQLMAALESKK